MARKSSRSAERASWSVALAAEVRRRRKELRLTQRELAALAQCGPDFLYDVENAKHTLRLDKLIDVLTALGLRLTLEPGSPGFVVRA